MSLTLIRRGRWTFVVLCVEALIHFRATSKFECKSQNSIEISMGLVGPVDFSNSLSKLTKLAERLVETVVGESFLVAPKVNQRLFERLLKENLAPDKNSLQPRL